MAYGSVYTLRVLMNDWGGDDDRELEFEHGLSFYVETPESRFLFDCGHTGAVWRNAEKMGVDLSAVQLWYLDKGRHYLRLPYPYHGKGRFLHCRRDT